ncbi:hypothetical protein IT072_03795 [Leifsonia sp. ZF2019]|uniref:hypothetical protein n=1 Tax=Leifsonia sp. ZF2019 TaxID=2781978 RepID=UPI001CBA9D82|nr:hypothetical protein [Leifsonia sp. ZF2019]UAJ80181.1 hypothetical protein IT072_03795 [Leifsonia sp. ZF2019]
MSDNHATPTPLRIVGLDLSLTATGVATIRGTEMSARTVRSKGKTDDGLLTRAVRLHKLTLDVLGWAALGDIVIIEQPAYGQTGGSHHDRSGLWWLVMDALTDDIDSERFAEVTPQGVKMYATGKGNASKSEVLAAVLKRYPAADVANDNEADAFVLAAIGARLAGQPIEESLPAANLRAIDKVRWAA